MTPDHDEDTCEVARAYRVWHDAVAIQEEHAETTDLGLSFSDSQDSVGWTEHQVCILPIIESMAEECMDSNTPAEAYLNIKSSLCQMALICFVLGRQREGAIL